MIIFLNSYVYKSLNAVLNSLSIILFSIIKVWAFLCTPPASVLSEQKSDRNSKTRTKGFFATINTAIWWKDNGIM